MRLITKQAGGAGYSFRVERNEADIMKGMIRNEKNHSGRIGSAFGADVPRLSAVVDESGDTGR